MTRHYFYWDGQQWLPFHLTPYEAGKWVDYCLQLKTSGVDKPRKENYLAFLKVLSKEKQAS